jgi:hypothetical protein
MCLSGAEFRNEAMSKSSHFVATTSFKLTVRLVCYTFASRVIVRERKGKMSSGKGIRRRTMFPANALHNPDPPPLVLGQKAESAIWFLEELRRNKLEESLFYFPPETSSQFRVSFKSSSGRKKT